ncbi:hypothetical protein ABZ801_01010 [Actinomadura sp. NPDC047616]|uniref:Gp37-like protein n=1 Tax=Actinomadura sp. NPDC047616 TaxID=3155914 RepID=UPI0033D4B04C
MIEELDLGTLTRRAPVPFRKLEINVAFNAAGSFTAELPATPRSWQLIRLDTDGNLSPVGLTVDWNGVAEFTLLAEQWGYQRTIDQQTGQITEVITLSGSDLLSLLANRIAYPDPAKPWASQPTATRTYSGPAETVIKQIITQNLVQAADPARRIPFLDIAPDLGRGGTVTYKVASVRPATTTPVGDAPTIAASLMDMVRSVAIQSQIGVRLTLEGTRLRFDTFLPRDLSSRAVFAAGLGNLAEANLTVADPTVTTVLTQAASSFLEKTATGSGDPWRRVEQFLDQTHTDTDAAQAATEALAQGAGKVQLAVNAVDLPRLRFGADSPGVTGYLLGDIVAVDLRDGVTFTDIVTKVQLTADTTGEHYAESVTPSIGTDPAEDQTLTAQLTARLRAVEKQLRATGP